MRNSVMPMLRLRRSSVVRIGVSSALMFTGLMLSPSAGASTIVSVQGQATLPSGAPADNLTMVYYAGNVYTSAPVYTTTDSSGDYSFSVSPGSGTLYLETGGNQCTSPRAANVAVSVSVDLPACTYMFTTLSVDDSTNEVSFLSGQAGTWESATSANLTLPAVSTLSLSALDPTSNLVSNAEFQSSIGGNSGSVCTSSASVEFGPCYNPLSDLPIDSNYLPYAPSGQASVLVYAGSVLRGLNDGGPDTLSISATSPDGALSGSLNLSSISGDGSYDISMVPKVSVTGAVMSGATTSVADATVTFTPTGSNGGVSTTTAADGSFSLLTTPGSGTLVVTTPGPANCASQGCAQGVESNTAVPPASRLQLAITIASDGSTTLVGSSSTPLGGDGVDLLVPLPAATSVNFSVVDEAAVAVPNALIRSNETQATTTFSIGGNTESVVWSLFGTTATSDSSGDWSLPVFVGPVQAYTDNNQGEVTALSFLAADPQLSTRIATQGVSEFTSLPETLTLALPTAESISGTLQTAGGQNVSGAVVMYVPDQPTLFWEVPSFYATTTSDASGDFSLPAGSGTGTLYFLSGGAGGATCLSQSFNANVQEFFSTDAVTSPVLPPCSDISVPVTVGGDGSVTGLGANPVAADPGSPFVVTLPAFDQLTMETTDFTTQTPAGGIPIHSQVYCLSPQAYSSAYAPNSSMFISWCPLGDSMMLTTDATTGMVSVPAWDGTLDASPNLLEWQSVPTGGETLDFALPDAPAAPSTVTASGASSGDATVTWSPPSTDGGSTITAFDVTATPDMGSSTSSPNTARRVAIRTGGGHATSVTVVAHATPVTASVSGGTYSTQLAGLAAGVGYSVAVVAVNAIGSSKPTTITYTPLLSQSPLTLTSTTGAVGTPLTLTTSGGSGTGVVSYSVTTGTAAGCSLKGAVLSATSAGTCFVTATKAADATYSAISSSVTKVTWSLSQVRQSPLTLTSTKGMVGAPLTLTTSGGSGTGVVRYSVTGGTANGCSIKGAVLSATSAGTCFVTATKAADARYSAASSSVTTVSWSLPARPARVTIVFGARSSALSAAAKAELGTLTQKLLPGATLSITVYANSSLLLAQQRARSIKSFLIAKRAVSVTMTYITRTKLSQAIITTTRQ